MSPFALDSPHTKAALQLPVAFEPSCPRTASTVSLERLVDGISQASGLDEQSWYSQFVADILA